MNLTKPQRQALKRVFDRVLAQYQFDVENYADQLGVIPEPHYRDFRRKVLPGPDCVMVKFAGMWLGIERDGYTHS